MTIEERIEKLKDEAEYADLDGCEEGAKNLLETAEVLEKLERCRRHYADHKKWGRDGGIYYDWWLQHEDGWIVAEEAGKVGV